MDKISKRNKKLDKPKKTSKVTKISEVKKSKELNENDKSAEEVKLSVADEPVAEVTKETSDEITQTNSELPPKRKRRRMSPANIILRVVLLAIVVGVVYFGLRAVVMHYLSIEAEKIRSAEINEVAITTSGNLTYDRFRDGVLVANGSNVIFYNSKGEVKWETTGFDGSPFIDVCGKYALISYTGSPNALWFNGLESKQITATGNIVTACINKNGYFALVMTEEGYKNQITVFDDEATPIYKWHSAENYVTGVAVSPDNKNMTVATVGFGDSSFATGILMFDFAQNKPHTGQQIGDNIVMDMQYVSKNRIVVVGDQKTSFYNKNGKKITDIDYQGKKLITYDFCNEGHTVLCFAKDDSVTSNSYIYTYTSKGKEMGYYETSGRIASVSCNERNILVSRDRQFDLLTEKCRKKATISVVKDVKNSVLFNKGKYAFGISGNSAHIITVK